ncbi:MAG TPA: ribosome biogenesis GTPase Der [Syntrophales bacterium]|nr:ribosome biogenesis GTPase Der [Syntrophales bacterium]HOX94720.1 ribosome biogenesis GTPase Der [Syntrophales bacterium]HPI58517.1 ribosome biogenesis GTPase Der [Syntrophales bacterium]HPN26220.1 ribosome biogenesis GTPase Der [Syntrophales bacterium]HQM30649.1 ribosome biogenesis GTPase Der [Syntrophales bacterium]
MNIKPIIAIIGRPNVGKSTLFNRLSEGKKAITIDEPGATRDRNYTDSTWEGRSFTIIDTGGFEPISTEKILVQMREQTMLAIEEADIILFLMDGRDGLTPSDEEIARLLRQVPKPVFYVVNKIDGPKHDALAYDFYRLGIEKLYPVSAEHGRGVDDLMMDVVDRIPAAKAVEADEERIRIAVVGRPNVGKSSLINKILGYERTIVNPLPGTTRDAIDTPFEYRDKKYLLIDTAGIRRKSRISMTLEKYTVVEALKTLSRCDIALILIDAEDGVTDQDARIAGLAYEKGVASILVVNKWDLIEKDNSTVGIHVKKIQDALKFLAFAPIIFVSAETGQRVTRIFDLIQEVYGQANRRIPTGELNDKVGAVLAANPPPRHAGRLNKIYYFTQISVKPPTFVFFVREPRALHFSYERFLSNQIREIFGFDKVPLRLIFRKKNR